ncbi:hypothetical protein ACMS9I_000073 [Escherichia coli O101,9,9a:H9]
MTYLLRKFSYSKWKVNKEFPPMHFTADAITNCIKTSKNQLSVWLSDSNDFSSDEVQKLVVALATTMDKPDVMDFVWLDTEWFKNEKIPLVYNKGTSKYESLNDKHRDLSELDLERLSKVGKHIIEKMEVPDNRKRFTKKEILALVLKWQIADNEFQITDLKPNWHEPLNELLTKS